MPAKLRYSTDKLNRLIVNRQGKLYPVEGEFKVEDNYLVFEPSRSSPAVEELGLSRRTRFEGNWALSENKNLKFVLVETDNQEKDDEIELRGTLASAEADALVFAMRTIKEPGVDRIAMLRLEGRWQADEFNQLNFVVRRDIEDDVLKLTGVWQINDNQKITYTYQRQDLIRKTKHTQAVAFDGHWQINSKERLVYILDLKNNSFFEFKAALEGLRISGKSGKIQYRLGIGVKELARERVISLFGAWRLGGRNTISFGIDYGNNRVKALVFGATVDVSRGELIFELRDRAGKDLGISVIFNKNFFRKDASVFARLKKAEDELRAEAGLRLRW